MDNSKIEIKNETGAFCWCVTILFLFTYGNPDLLDALIKWFMK